MRALRSQWGLTSVRMRLTLWNITILALSLAGFAAIVHFTVGAVLIASVDQDLVHEAHFAIANLQPGNGSTQLDHMFVLSHDSRSLPERHGFMVIRTLDGKEHTLAVPDPDPLLANTVQGAITEKKETWNLHTFAPAAQSKEAYRTVKRGKQEWRMLTQPWPLEGKKNGVVQVAYPLTDVNAALQGLDRTILLLIPLALLVTGTGGAFLSSRALLPVREIAQAAAALEASDLSRRLPCTTGDEFGELATTFNGMFGRLETAFTRLEAAVEQQRRFTADASHELRTPLTTIKANADWALRRKRTPEEYEEALRATIQAANRMDHLLEDLLCLARSENNPSSQERCHVQIANLFTSALDSVKPTQGAATVEIDVPDPTLSFVGEPFALERLFVNLLENALRHTPSEGRIVLSAREQEGQIALTVRDNGAGIPASHLPHIFERFYRVDAARSRANGGAGLGLAICRSIVEAHQGSIAIQSAEGIGTTVTICLPGGASGA